MVKYKNLTNQLLAKMRNNRNSHSLLVDCKMVESLWKQFLTELNVVIQHDLSITLLDCSANDLIMPTQKHAHEYYNSLIHTLSHPQIGSNELSSHKKKWMKPEWMLLSKISYSGKGYTLHAANYMALCKRSNCRANKKYQRLLSFASEEFY